MELWVPPKAKLAPASGFLGVVDSGISKQVEWAPWEVGWGLSLVEGVALGLLEAEESGLWVEGEESDPWVFWAFETWQAFPCWRTSSLSAWTQVWSVSAL